MLSNWSGTTHCEPASTAHPRSMADVQQLVRTWSGGHIKVCNALPHSPNDIWCTDGLMVILASHVNRLVSLDIDSVTVEAGMQLETLVETLRSVRRQLTVSLPSIRTMTIGGAMATGAHGSAPKQGPLSSAVTALKLVIASGEVLQCSETENADVFAAALCSLGALGIVVEVTMMTQPLAYVAERRIWSDGSLDFARLTASHDFVKLYSYGSGGALSIVGNWTEAEPPAPSSAFDIAQLLQWAAKRCETVLFSVFYLLLPLAVCSWLLTRWTRHITPRPTPGNSVLVASEPSSPILEIPQFTCEYAVPLSKANQVWQQLTALHKLHSSYPTHFFEVRFVAADTRSLISPTSTRLSNEPFVYFGLVSYKPFGRTPPHLVALFDAFGRVCVGEAGGRPHYAKTHGLIADDFARIYGERWTAFRSVRKRLDKDGVFLNSHLRGILGL